MNNGSYIVFCDVMNEACAIRNYRFNEDGDDAFFMKQHCSTIDDMLAGTSVYTYEFGVEVNDRLYLTINMNIFEYHKRDECMLELFEDAAGVSFHFVDEDTISVVIDFGIITMLGAEYE